MNSRTFSSNVEATSILSSDQVIVTLPDSKFHINSADDSHIEIKSNELKYQEYSDKSIRSKSGAGRSEMKSSAASKNIFNCELYSSQQERKLFNSVEVFWLTIRYFEGKISLEPSNESYKYYFSNLLECRPHILRDCPTIKNLEIKIT